MKLVFMHFWVRFLCLERWEKFFAFNSLPSLQPLYQQIHFSFISLIENRRKTEKSFAASCEDPTIDDGKKRWRRKFNLCVVWGAKERFSVLPSATTRLEVKSRSLYERMERKECYAFEHKWVCGFVDNISSLSRSSSSASTFCWLLLIILHL